MIPYRQKLLEAQMNAANRPKAVPGKISQLEQLRDRFEPGTPDYQKFDEALTAALKGNNGITLFDPSGNPMVQIGGGSSAGGKGQGGKIYQNEKGEQFQTPTNAVLTQMQNRVAGEALVEPYIKNMIETLPQFQSGLTQLKSIGEGVLNKWAGTDYDLPSQFAEGQASKGLAAEGMLRQFGLNATTENLKRMEDILTPQKGESEKGYERRAKRQSRDFISSKLKAQSIARSGINVKESNLAASKIDTSKYDLPEGSVILYKKGVGYAFPQELVDEKLAAGYSYE